MYRRFLATCILCILGFGSANADLPDNLKPIPIIKINGQTSNFTVTVGETVTFDGFDSYDPDCGTSGCISDFQWYFNPPGPYISRDSIYTHVFSQPDTIVVKLTVRDDVMPYKYASLEVDLVILAQGNPPDLPNEYYVTDHLGSIRAAVDEDGFIAKQSDYYPFGLRMPGRILIEGAPVREGYTGHELDDETGLNYAGARYLDTEIGRWLSVDPLADKYPTWSPFNYVLNSPLLFSDPTGLYPTCGYDCDEFYESGSIVNNDFGHWEYLGNGLWLDLNTDVISTGPELLAEFTNLTEEHTHRLRALAPVIPVVAAEPTPIGEFLLGAAALGLIFSDMLEHRAEIEQVGDTGVLTYTPPPRTLAGFPGAVRVRPKAGRARWKDINGDILEWDSLHGEIEKYNKTGKRHKGSFDPDTGQQVKPKDPRKRTSN